MHTVALSSVLAQHAEDAVQLRNTRSAIIRSPHVELHRLSRTDDRIAAHIDGLMVAEAQGQRISRSWLNPPNLAAMFVSTILAVEAQDGEALNGLVALAESNPEARGGLDSAMGWIKANSLKKMIGEWFSDSSIAKQRSILSACGYQGVDPGEILRSYFRRDEPQLITCALKVARVLGRTELLSLVLLRLDANLASSEQPESETYINAGLSAVILGNRTTALDALKRYSFARRELSDQCFKLAILALPIEPTYAWLREWASVAKEPWVRRRLIRGCGLSGDVRYIPRLIEQMNDLTVSRLAGESFSFITGAHLALLDLERKPPENAPGGPNDDPADENVAMDEDEGLPWPDVARVHAWWTANAARFPAGHRYLVGAPASEAQCLKVLRSGGQRQRAVAAVTRCLLRPGTPLFQVAAPAWRQQRWLTELGA